MIVVDTSVAASWFLLDELNPQAKAVLDAIDANRTILVPSLWLLELTNTMLAAKRRRRIEARVVDHALEHVKALPLKIAPSPTVFSPTDLMKIAEKHALSAYDAEYIRIARQFSAPLATLDRALRKASVREGITLFDNEKGPR